MFFVLVLSILFSPNLLGHKRMKEGWHLNLFVRFEELVDFPGDLESGMEVAVEKSSIHSHLLTKKRDLRKRDSSEWHKD